MDSNFFRDLATTAIKQEASDIHITSGTVPLIRSHGKLEPYLISSVLTPEKSMEIILGLMNQNQKEVFLKELELDFSINLAGVGRFRANAYFQKGVAAATFRYIPDKVLSIDELRLPDVCHAFAKLRQGFVLVTGPTGTGKSTTLAAIIREINETRQEHIVTIEDPIEFIHENKRSFVTQRELGGDTKSWDNSLRSVLRQDPNVVFIGEMRDPDTMQAAMTVAETGHLVFSTLHTNSAAQSIERIVDSFKTEEQPQVLLQLSMVLEAIVSQRLVPTIDGKRVLATEILIVTPAVRNNIRESKTFQIDNIIQTSGNLGMRLLENSLAEFVNRGMVDKNVAMEYAIRPTLLNKLLGGR